MAGTTDRTIARKAAMSISKTSLPERGEVLATVGDHSRRIAHQPADKRLSEMESELSSLLKEKQDLEAEAARITGWKHDETAKILAGGFSKTVAIEKTNRLEGEVARKRRDVISQIKAIEQRIHALKPHLYAARDKARDRQQSPQLEVLCRIESVLIQILQHLKQEIK